MRSLVRHTEYASCDVYGTVSIRESTLEKSMLKKSIVILDYILGSEKRSNEGEIMYEQIA
jgi:hypothetical protein